jgi:glutathione S-transferase
MITLHHAPTTRSFRIKWLLGELSLPYQLKVRDFYNQERVDPEFLRLNPMGSFPALEDDELVLTESGAMVNHIVNRYGEGKFRYPAGSREAAQVEDWMYWSEGLFAIHQRYFWDHCLPSPARIPDHVPKVGEYGKRQAIKYAHMLESSLRDDGFVVGDTLTGADFMLSFPVYTANVAGWFETLPKIRAYAARLAARPAFQQAIEDFAPYVEKMFGAPAAFESFRDWETNWLERLKL